MNLMNGFLSLFYPSECLCCKRYIKDFKYFFVCPDCFNHVKEIDKHSSCKICLKPLSSEFVDVCVECRERVKTYFECIEAAGFYESPLKELIYQLKFYQKKKAGKILADYVLSKVQDDFFKNIDIITYVPISKRTKERRNFNHTEILALYIGSKKRIKVMETMKKIKETEDQSSLKREARLKNLKDAFEIKNDIKEKIFKKKILVIDDIYTTGSTMNEVSKVLKENGTKEIFGLVIARSL